MEDASRSDPDFLKKICKAVVEAGVDRISITDTVGAMLPKGIFRLVKMVHDVVNVPLDIHCHNDLGLALPNSLAGFEAGADQIHTSINGLGERVGIPSLAEVTVSLIALYGIDLDLRLDMLRELSDLISTYINKKNPESTPIIGENAYKHKAGTHLAAIVKNPKAYELIPPHIVGNKRKIIFGELSGKGSVNYFLESLGLNPNKYDAVEFAKGLKALRVGDLFELELSENT
jgi:2-isopropylmalate synthase